METLRRWREAAVIVVLLVLAVRLLLVAVAALSPAVVGVESGVDAAYVLSSQLGDATVFVLLAALVAACHAAPVTPHARQLTWIALVLAAGSLLVIGVLAVLGYASFPSPLRRIELGSRLLGLVLPIAAVVALGLLVPRSSAGRPALAAGPEPAADDAADEDAPALAPAADPQLAPTWEPDTAAGAAWWSAGEAASGRPAAGWGAPDPAAGWQPGFERPATEPGPDPSATDGPTAPEAEPPHPWSTAPRT